MSSVPLSPGLLRSLNIWRTCNNQIKADFPDSSYGLKRDYLTIFVEHFTDPKKNGTTKYETKCLPQHRRLAICYLIRAASRRLTPQSGGVCDIDGHRLVLGCSRQLPTHCSKSQMLSLSLSVSCLNIPGDVAEFYISSCRLTRWGNCTNRGGKIRYQIRKGNINREVQVWIDNAE